MRLFRWYSTINDLTVNNPLDTAYMRAENQIIQSQRWIPLASVSNSLQWAIVYGEDRHFLSHRGITFSGIRRSWRQMRDPTHIWPGGSSISMQLARNLFLSPEKRLTRKANEACLACVMEVILTKPRIFELYLNVFEMGPGLWGVNEGCQHYCDKLPSQINLVEAVFLAAMLGAPKRPIRGGNLARMHAKFGQIATALWRDRLVTSEQFILLSETGAIVLRHLGKRGSLKEAMGFCRNVETLDMNVSPFTNSNRRLR